MAQIIIGLAIGTGISVIIFLFYKKFLDRHSKSSFDDLSRKTLADMMPQLLDLAKRELIGVREEINKDVEKEKQAIAESLNKLEKNIKEKQDELKRLEGERNRQFGSIVESMKVHRDITEKLSEKTENLSKILANNKLRGSWGERIAEDILRYAGFIEDVHYVKQTQVAGGTIPDFTLLLPNKRKINIDAKFPFANLQAFQDTADEAAKKVYMQKFSQDIKQKIREVTTRDYINEEDDTLDYVILFVPSEAVYGFINDYLKEVVDEAFLKKVLFTSPTSFYATLRIIMESYRNFMYEKNIRQILKVMQGFVDNFQRFQDEFSTFDEVIKKLRTTYDQITETRYKKMQVQIRKIEQLEQPSDTSPLLK